MSAAVRFGLVSCLFIFASCRMPAPACGIDHSLVSLTRAATVALVEEDPIVGDHIYCSGVLLNSVTVLTAAHCLDDESSPILVATESSFEASSYTVFYPTNISVKHDLALLTSNSEVVSTSYALLAEEAPVTGDSLVIVGHPRALGWTVTEGIVSYDKRLDMREGTALMQHQAPVFFGNSGGPVFNLQGELVGIVSGGINGATHLGFSVHLDIIKEFLR